MTWTWLTWTSLTWRALAATWQQGQTQLAIRGGPLSLLPGRGSHSSSGMLLLQGTPTLPPLPAVTIPAGTLLSTHMAPTSGTPLALASLPAPTPSSTSAPAPALHSSSGPALEPLASAPSVGSTPGSLVPAGGGGCARGTPQGGYALVPFLGPPGRRGGTVGVLWVGLSRRQREQMAPIP